MRCNRFWTVCGLVKRVDFGLELGRGLVAERGVFPVVVMVGAAAVLAAAVAVEDEVWDGVGRDEGLF
jgi:hypothetical protein